MSTSFWAWGVDVSTRAVSIGALKDAGGHDWFTVEWEAGTQGAQRLARIRQAMRVRLEAVPHGRRPTVIVVENPLIVRPDFRLLTAVGVVMEVLHSTMHCPVLELTTGQWKKEALGFGNAGKAAVAEFAREQLGYDGDLQDECDALCIAVTALNRAREATRA